MDAVKLTDLFHTLQAIVVASFIFSACLLLSKYKHHSQLSKLLTMGGSSRSEKHGMAYMQYALQMYVDGYKQVKCLLILDCVCFN